MAKYVLISTTDQSVLKRVNGEKEFRTGSPPTLPIEKGIKWLVLEELPRPSFDPYTHEIIPTVVQTDTTRIEGWELLPLSGDALIKATQAQISKTDKHMSRMVEDIFVAIALGKPLTKLSFPSALWDKINNRRKLRGEDEI